MDVNGVQYEGVLFANPSNASSDKEDTPSIQSISPVKGNNCGVDEASQSNSRTTVPCPLVSP